MESARTDEIDRALSRLRRSADPASRSGSIGETNGRSWRPGRVCIVALLLAVAVLLPFLLLVKVSVFMHLAYGMTPYVAMGMGALVMSFLLVLYTHLIDFRIRGRVRYSAFVARCVGLLVAVFCLYSLLYISAGNVKAPVVRETYTSLHPLLRLAVSTLVLADGESVVTDTRREAADYRRMGLPPNQRSLHLPQSTGYVHAIDLRTSGRGWVRNLVVSAYFRLMGFTTIRHVGTADHLHISLPVVKR